MNRRDRLVLERHDAGSVALHRRDAGPRPAVRAPVHGAVRAGCVLNAPLDASGTRISAGTRRHRRRLTLTAPVEEPGVAEHRGTAPASVHDHPVPDRIVRGGHRVAAHGHAASRCQLRPLERPTERELPGVVQERRQVVARGIVPTEEDDAIAERIVDRGHGAPSPGQGADRRELVPGRRDRVELQRPHVIVRAQICVTGGASEDDHAIAHWLVHRGHAVTARGR